MSTSIFIWIVLVIVGVSDAKAHRIPNKLLLFLLILLCLSILMQTQKVALGAVFLDKGAAFGMAFAFSFALYLIKVMAPGDVKLIAVLGFFLGTEELVSYLYYVCLLTAYVGSMYWFLNRLYMELKAIPNREISEQVSRISFTGMAATVQIEQQDLEKKVVTYKKLTYMPFAPILVMGLALHQYYS